MVSISDFREEGEQELVGGELSQQLGGWQMIVFVSIQDIEEQLITKDEGRCPKPNG